MTTKPAPATASSYELFELPDGRRIAIEKSALDTPPVKLDTSSAKAAPGQRVVIEKSTGAAMRPGEAASREQYPAFWKKYDASKGGVEFQKLVSSVEGERALACLRPVADVAGVAKSRAATIDPALELEVRLQKRGVAAARIAENDVMLDLMAGDYAARQVTFGKRCTEDEARLAVERTVKGRALVVENSKLYAEHYTPTRALPAAEFIEMKKSARLIELEKEVEALAKQRVVTKSSKSLEHAHSDVFDTPEGARLYGLIETEKAGASHLVVQHQPDAVAKSAPSEALERFIKSLAHDHRVSVPVATGMALESEEGKRLYAEAEAAKHRPAGAKS